MDKSKLERIGAICYTVIVGIDCVLMVLGNLWDKGIKVGIIKDKIDDLLDVRLEMANLIKCVKKEVEYGVRQELS